MALDRLSAADRLVLWPDPIWPQDVGALGILAGGTLHDTDGRFRLELARETVAARLHLVPRLRQVVHRPPRGLGGPLWVDTPTFDLSQHVQTIRVPPPGDEVELLASVEQLRGRRLDPSRPLWEMWFLTGLPEGRIGWFVRLHHVVADGVAGVADLGALLDPAAQTRPRRPRRWTPVPAPSTRDLLTDTLRHRAGALARAAAVLGQPAATASSVRAAWPAMRELLAGEPGPETTLDRVIGADRTLALVRGRMQAVTDIAHECHATVNDVLLAVIAGGLRTLLSSRGEPVDGLTLPIYVPVSLRRDEPGGDGGNLIGQMIVRLPIGVREPRASLEQIAQDTATRKGLARPSLGALFGSRILRPAMLQLIVRQRVNVVSADLRGPSFPCYFAGAELLELFPLVNLVGNESLGVGALSYAGQFNIMAVADADAHPDLDVFAAGMRAELAALTAEGPRRGSSARSARSAPRARRGRRRRAA